jgi:hypothetical protein
MTVVEIVVEVAVNEVVTGSVALDVGGLRVIDVIVEVLGAV